MGLLERLESLAGVMQVGQFEEAERLIEKHWPMITQVMPRLEMMRPQQTIATDIAMIERLSSDGTREEIPVRVDFKNGIGTGSRGRASKQHKYVIIFLNPEFTKEDMVGTLAHELTHIAQITQWEDPSEEYKWIVQFYRDIVKPNTKEVLGTALKLAERNGRYPDWLQAVLDNYSDPGLWDDATFDAFREDIRELLKGQWRTGKSEVEANLSSSVARMQAQAGRLAGAIRNPDEFWRIVYEDSEKDIPDEERQNWYKTMYKELTEGVTGQRVMQILSTDSSLPSGNNPIEVMQGLQSEEFMQPMQRAAMMKEAGVLEAGQREEAARVIADVWPSLERVVEARNISTLWNIEPGSELASSEVILERVLPGGERGETIVPVKFIFLGRVVDGRVSLRALGRFNTRTRDIEIYVAPGMTRAIVQSVLVHEMTHAAQFGYASRTPTAQAVDFIMTVLQGVDNPIDFWRNVEETIDQAQRYAGGVDKTLLKEINRLLPKKYMFEPDEEYLKLLDDARVHEYASMPEEREAFLAQARDWFLEHPMEVAGAIAASKPDKFWPTIFWFMQQHTQTPDLHENEVYKILYELLEDPGYGHQVMEELSSFRLNWISEALEIARTPIQVLQVMKMLKEKGESGVPVEPVEDEERKVAWDPYPGLNRAGKFKMLLLAR